MSTEQFDLKAELAKWEGLALAASPGARHVVDDNEGDGWPPRPLWLVVNDAYSSDKEEDEDAGLRMAVDYGGKCDADLAAFAGPDFAIGLISAIRRERAELLQINSDLQALVDKACDTGERERSASIDAQQKLSNALAEVEKELLITQRALANGCFCPEVYLTQARAAYDAQEAKRTDNG